MKIIRSIVIGIAMVSFAGCTNMSHKQQGTLSGAAIGAAAGAGIAAIAGGSGWTGAAIGGVAGGIAGNIYGGHWPCPPRPVPDRPRRVAGRGSRRRHCRDPGNVWRPKSLSSNSYLKYSGRRTMLSASI
jgi:hypothetical protein